MQRDILQLPNMCSLILTMLLAMSAAWSATSLNLDAGIRRDNFSFNIAGNLDGESPTVLSELRWRDVKSSQLTASATHDLSRQFILEGSLGYGWIGEGFNQDSDYFGDNRTEEFSRSFSDTVGDNTLDGSVALGYQGTLKQGYSYTVLGGYSLNRQHLRDKNLVQIIPNAGPISGENSTYQAHWSGPWVGLAGKKAINDRLAVRLRAEYHWTSFDAVGDWNLRDDFAHPKSFSQQGDGNGTEVSLGAEYRVNERWNIDLNAAAGNNKAKNGVDTVFFANGASASTRLNDATWHSKTLTLQGTYRF